MTRPITPVRQHECAAGLEYILLQPTVFLPGWLRKPAEHVSACVASLTAEADSCGQPFPSFLKERARRAK